MEETQEKTPEEIEAEEKKKALQEELSLIISGIKASALYAHGYFITDVDDDGRETVRVELWNGEQYWCKDSIFGLFPDLETAAKSTREKILCNDKIVHDRVQKGLCVNRKNLELARKGIFDQFEE